MTTKKKIADDKLTSTAKVIGSTLGMLAAKVGINTPAPKAKRKIKKDLPTKSLVKKPGTKRAPKKAK